MTHRLRDWLAEQPFTLSLSSGFFGFFAHAGLLSVLEAEGLLPRRLTGSSAGALIAGCYAAGLNSAALRDLLFTLTRASFWDPAPGFGLLKGEKFRRQLADVLPVARVEDCALPLALSVFDLQARQTRVMTEGSLVAAIYASSALPLLFQPLRHQGRWLADGGIKDRPALAGIAAGERVFYHHIASRSPWRRAASPALRLPERDNLLALAIENLPRCGPYKLTLGPTIYRLAAQASRDALDRPVDEGKIAINIPY